MKTLYLAVLPRCRKPKAIAPRSLGYYQQNAKYVYEAQGMTATQARTAIKEGSLTPTWINGERATTTNTDTTKPKRISLQEVLCNSKYVGNYILRIGSDIYTAQRCFHGTQPGISWHKVDCSGYLYSQDPLRYKDLQRYYVEHATFDLVELTEYAQNPDSLAPMATYHNVARTYKNFELDSIRKLDARYKNLDGRQFAIKHVWKGGRIG